MKRTGLYVLFVTVVCLGLGRGKVTAQSSFGQPFSASSMSFSSNQQVNEGAVSGVGNTFGGAMASSQQSMVGASTGGTGGGLFGGSGQAILSAVGFTNLFSQGQAGRTNQATRGAGMLGGGLGGLGRGGLGRGGLGNLQNRLNTNRSSQSQVTYRTQLRVAFPYPQVSASGVGVRLARDLESPSIEAVGSPLSVAVEADAGGQGHVAVLRGTVATEGDRQVAEHLARLEPDISSVRNEIQVRPPVAVDAVPPSFE